MPESSPATNAPELSVTELSSALKRTIEDRFAYVRVRGEVSNYRGPHSSGHVYFSLKDQGARIDAVIWKGAFSRMRIRPEEGMEVIATGKITTFPGKSAYQIIVEAMEPAGIGALMALLEARRVKLAAEGLFDAARKQLPPYLPAVIGVVTSPTGAVIRDILHRLSDRFPVHVLVWPVRVQGETSAAEVASAIAGFNALAPDGAIPRPDVLIVARGGGSLEDLWSFNEEIVLRAAAESLIPLLSAIGHETDWTLLDHVADVRAPTPTAAAERSVPVRSELLANLADLEARRRGAILRVAERARAALRASARALPSGETLLAAPRQRLDRADAALGASAQAGFHARAIALERLSRRLAARSPQALLASALARHKGAARSFARAATLDRQRRREQIVRLAARLQAAQAAQARFGAQQRTRMLQAESRLRRALQSVITQRRARVAAAAQVLNAVSYRNVLRRGFALVRDGAGAPLHSAAAIGADQPIRIEFADGEIGAVARGQMSAGAADPPGKGSATPRLGRARKREPRDDQGSLF
jgi:exodeoxyribonuclease VII large subunit